MAEYLSKINVLTQTQYDSAVKNENEIYLITDVEGDDSGVTTNTTAFYRPVSTGGLFQLNIAEFSNFVIRAEGGNASITIENIPQTGGLYHKINIILEYKQSTEISFPASFLWVEGSTPTFSANNIYVIALNSHTKGGIWFASIEGRYPYNNIDDIPLNDSDKIIVYDYFNRPNSENVLGVSSSGHTWEVTQGTWGIIDNTAYATGSSSKFAVIETGRTDNIRISVDYLYNSNSDAGIVFGYLSTSDYLQLTHSGSKLAMRHPTKGEIGTGIAASLTNNVWYTLSVEIEGSEIRVYLDGVLMITGTYNITTNASKHGFKHFSGANIRYDNFIVEEI